MRSMFASPAERFSQLYKEHVERIYRYHLVRSGDVSVAEDLTAETFRAAYESYSRFNPLRGSPAAWLVGIAHHKLVDWLRTRRPQVSVEGLEELLADNQPVEDAVWDQLQLDSVIRCLRQISPERAEAVALYYFAGLNQREVARVMNKSEQAAKKLIQRGLQELRRRLLDTDEVIR